MYLLGNGITLNSGIVTTLYNLYRCTFSISDLLDSEDESQSPSLAFFSLVDVSSSLLAFNGLVIPVFL